MAWCHQATSHYLSQCWPRSLSPYDVTRPQWVNWTAIEAGIILGMGSANERWRYIVTSSLVGWAHTQNDAVKLGAIVWWTVIAHSCLTSSAVEVRTWFCNYSPQKMMHRITVWHLLHLQHYDIVLSGTFSSMCAVTCPMPLTQINCYVNSLWPNDAKWWHETWSILAQMMACCLMAPSHYLNHVDLSSVRFSDWVQFCNIPEPVSQ